MSLHERDALGADIEKNGQLIPIVTCKGEIVDGRNRYLAMIARGIEPTIIEMTKMSVKDLVASMNYFRKHWSTKERAHFAALMSLDSEEGRPEKTASNEAVSESDAAKAMGVSRSSVQRAKAKIKGKKPRPKQDETGKPVDKIGYLVPPEALPYWNRRQEVLDLLHHISAARSAIRNLPSKDKMYWYVNLQRIEQELDSPYRQLAGVLPDYVCPYCNGHNVDKCDGCQGTGVLSEPLWKRAPESKRKKHEK